jgi:hypothetical protein
MKKKALTCILVVMIGSFATSQNVPLDSMYLGQTSPGATPRVFKLAVSPGTFAAERIAISNDGSEIIYSELKAYYPISLPKVKRYIYSDNHWIGPFSVADGYLAPALSVTSDTLFYQDDSVRTFLSIKNGSGWNTPKRILNTLISPHYFQSTNNGNYYISSRSEDALGGADWCRVYMDGNDTTALSLGIPLNTGSDNLDFCVSRDESFMIISRPSGLSISYSKEDGNWTNPKNLGSTINFGLGMWGSYVSADNKYLFYTTGTQQDYSDVNVYWVRVDSLIDHLKQTNFVPYLKNKINNQTDTVGYSFNFTIPDNTFVDDDGNETLTFDARLSNGKVLPSWLTFDTISGTFSGTPISEETINIRVKAIDDSGAYALTLFKIDIKKPYSIDQKKVQGMRIFPNPTKGLLHISIGEVSEKIGYVEITNLEGKVILADAIKKETSYDLSENPKGVYLLKLMIENELFFSKICIQ